MSASTRRRRRDAIALPPLPVASVVVTPSVNSVSDVHTVQLSATAYGVTGCPLSNRSFSWSSSNTSIATVNASGLVTAVAVGGPITITATAEDIDGTASVEVFAGVVSDVIVTPSTANVYVNWTQQLTAVAKDDDGHTLPGRVITWSSSDETIATVDSSGLVTGVADGGPVTITATCEEIDGTSDITVALAPVDHIDVDPSTVGVVIDNTEQLTATLYDAHDNILTGRDVTWSSSDEEIATVDSTGLVTTVDVGGPITITATSEDVDGTSAVTVLPGVLHSFTISGYPASSVAGDAFDSPDNDVVVTAKDIYGNIKTNYLGTVVFTSTDGEADLPLSYEFTEEDAGVVTFAGSDFTLKTTGNQTITVEDETAEISATTDNIDVTPAALASYSITGYPTTTITGEDFASQNVVVSAYDAYNNLKSDYAGSVYFTSTDNAATVPYTSGSQYTFTTGSGNDNGTHTFAGSGFTLSTIGSATITVTNGTISATSSSITISPIPVATVEVSPSSASIAYGDTQQLTATTKDASGNVLTGRTVTWSSNHTEYATVDSSGLVTAVSGGTATITATSETKTGTSTITVASSQELTSEDSKYLYTESSTYLITEQLPA